MSGTLINLLKIGVRRIVHVFKLYSWSKVMNQFYSAKFLVISIFTALVLYSIGSARAESAPERAEALYQEARDLKSSGKTDLAISKLRQALKLNPDSGECLNDLSQALMETRCLKEAASMALKAVKLNPKNSKYQANLGAIMSHLEKDKAAEEALRKAIKLDPSNIEARYQLAKLLCKSRQDESLDNALKQIKMAVLLKPGSSRFHSVMGDIYYLKKQYRDSLYEYRKSESLSGGKSLNGNLRQRISYLRKVLKEDEPDSAGILPAHSQDKKVVK